MSVGDTKFNSLTRACINLDHLTHNLHLLQTVVGKRPMWPAIVATMAD